MDNVRDYAIKNGMKAAELVDQMASAGFQASEIGDAVRLIRQMKKDRATVFLSFTANMVASGLRGIITKLVKERYVDVIITTGGAIDHDIIRSGKPYLMGDFNLNDEDLHKRGINRLGNILIPSDRYIFLEKFIQQLFSELKSRKRSWTPSDFIYEAGKRIKDEGSFLHWASKNNIPVFCPGITDSAIGLQLYFFKQDNKDFEIDVSGDMKLADIVINSEKTGGIILGGGIAKHHTIGVNILKEGLDYAVYVTTSSAWDGSLSGATPNEAKSWSKVKEKGGTVTVYGDASVIVPLIFAKVFG
ncbi:MAG: deoxyhypusine synthase [Candidatus Aenigmarchaeota archaeon]|nr:deoxyhypusine synthase [Candidatus Aenigmarchaeota archaeon]